MIERPELLLPDGYLHTGGASILAGDGSAVRLAGVNWYGCECESMVPGGLDNLTVDEMCAAIVAMGFNHIRLPYCDELVLRNPLVDAGLAAMPTLRGAGALAVIDAVVESAGRHHLKVILDSHRSEPGWSAQGNGLWYSQRCPPARWREALLILARRYRGNDTVIGIDLRNEPGAPPVDADEYPRNGGAVWGEPDRPWTRHPRDWAAAAEAAGNEVLAANPNLLIIVEGVRADPAGPFLDGVRHLYWPGGNLCGVARPGGRRRRPRPIELHVAQRLVYSAHDYGPATHPGLPWCQPGTTAALAAAACRTVWEQTWGFIARQGIAPLYLGEFGTPNGLWPGHVQPAGTYIERQDENPQGSWFSDLVEYLDELGASWAYWPLNGRNSPGGGRDPRLVEGYGLLTPDHSGPSNPLLLATLARIQGPPRGG